MRIIRTIIFVFCMFIAALGANAFCKNFHAENFKSEGIIYSTNIVDFDLNLNNESAPTEAVSQAFSSGKRIYDFESNQIKDDFYENQIQKIISYIYLKSYLDNKEKHFYKISFQIIPNAP